MSQAKKFGAFAGVFTPSILTILGVIMYMRLGWVVGQAGLINTLAIILIAHVISISTGLSISSIATDKKIRTGGIYYMLSRSLGLPAGGAIGLTIFVGTALSISLYIIGFAESFLSLDAISDFLHLAPGIDGYRIVGTVVIILLVVLAFISTSVVIKTQYFILGAIALSLISIVVGIFWRAGYHPPQININPVEGGEPLALIFGIFFPAVTGFTAGVAMSGDLKNPKTAIPKGTMLAITVGLIVYVGLAVLFAMFVRRDMLIGDPEFLLKIAWFSPLVIAGIWGATLSSALGGILGAPRIMQAMAQDKLSPRIFAKGFGKNNEPRTALILTFLIAEAGILIGELNVIAGVVSMFYIAAYGFINLAFTLENWASADFRPSFKINRWIGIVGFIACFAVMYELDPLAMVAAIVIIGIIYVILRRQDVRSELGDVWTSVWNSLTRSALSRANRRRLEERNWRPNIILFSGGTKARPHLVDFGKWMVGKHGFLSNFDLTEGTQEETIVPKRKQAVQSKEKEGIFIRNHVCTNIYEGIETIAQTYGFSGIEPNTVLMGWAKQTKDPERFVQMLDNLYKLDLNVLMLDYDQKRGFGKYQEIDLYVTPNDINGLFPLYLVRFLWYTEKWAKSHLRLFVINDGNEDSKSIFRSASNLLDKVRIDGEIRILNNHFEQRPHHELILNESQNADLIILGIPDFKKRNSKAFIDATDILCRDLGSVLLVKSSSEFEKLTLSYQTGTPVQLQAFHRESDESIPEIIHPELKSLVNPEIVAVKDVLEKYGNDITASATMIDNFFHKLLEDCKKTFWQTDEAMQTGLGTMALKRATYRKLIINLRSHYLQLKTEILPALNSIIINASERVSGELKQIVRETPYMIEIERGNESVRSLENDSDASKKYRAKLKVYLEKKQKGKKANIPVQKIISGEIIPELQSFLSHNENHLINLIISQYVVIQQLHDTLVKSYISFFKDSGKDEQQTLDEIRAEVTSVISKGVADNDNTSKELLLATDSFAKKVTCGIVDLLNQPILPKKEVSIPGKEKQLQAFLSSTEERNNYWQQNQNLLLNSLDLEVSLMLFSTTAESSSNEIIDAMSYLITEGTIASHHAVIDLLKDGDISIQKIREVVENDDIKNETTTRINNAFNRLQRKIQRFPNTFFVHTDENLNDLASRVYDQPDVMEVKSRQLLDHLYQQEFAAKIRKSLNRFMKASGESMLKEQEIITRLSVSGFSGNEKDEFIQDHIRILLEEVNVLESLKEDFENEVYHTLEVYSSRLSLQPFLRTAANLRHYIRSREREKANDIFTKFFTAAGNKIRKLFTNLWYRQSRGVLLHERLVSAENSSSVAESISRITAKTVNGLPLSEVPFHYRQLFLRKQQYSPEFWVGRSREVKEFELFRSQYRQLRKGGILVTGERHTGKTYFCEHVAANAPSYIVSPPQGGTTSRRAFYAILADSLEAEDKTWQEALESLPDNSIVIFDNLELWWSRTENGNVILEIIQKIIDKYSDRILFIANTGKESYRFMRRVSTIDQAFLGEVRLMPFDAREIETIIMRRHKAAGIPFSIQGRDEQNYRSLHFARLFTKYFSFSSGNIGITLAAWIANIIKVEEDMLMMRYPIIPDDLPLENLEENTLLSLIQLMLHHQMSADKLSRVMQLKKEEATSILDTLLKKNLITVNDSGIYEANPVMYRFIIERLKKAELL